MKRLALLLVVLIIIGGVVFYFGWIQIKLDEDSYGVIFTKTGGWEEEVVAPGHFTWRVQRLLPTNLTLHVFPVKPQSVTANLRGSLPGAATYASLLETSTPFSYAITVEIQYRIKPDSLPQLAQQQGLRSEDLPDYYRRTDDQVEQVVIEAALRSLEDAESLQAPASAIEEIARAVESALQRSFPELEITTVSPTRVELPDLDLYSETRERYLSILETRAESMRESARNMSDEQAVMDAGLARLERYGEILEQYPILLDYFSLMQEFPEAPLDLEALIPQPGT